jgi:gluconolactonase
MESMILSLIFGTIINLSSSCDLLPGNPPGSCMDLRATPYVTPSQSQFGPYIEGASTNRAGEIFAVNYGNGSTMYNLGQIYPTQRLFYSDSLKNSLLNGIRFLNDHTAFAVDAVNHRVLRLNVVDTSEGVSVDSSTVFCSDPNMLQPNDLTLSRTGTVFTSGMRWISDTDNTHGDIWSCTLSGQVKKLEVMGRTNGIDLSPDERTLYVSESYNRGGSPYIQKIWKYNVDVVEGTISGKTLFADFEAIDGSIQVDIDGMKTDVNGNLYVTRHGGRQVVVFSQAGDIIGKIALNFPNPTNLELGGPSGTTLFAVGKCDGSDQGCVDMIELAIPGRSWSNLQLKLTQ